MRLLWALRQGGPTALTTIEPLAPAKKPPPKPDDKEPERDRAVSVVPELMGGIELGGKQGKYSHTLGHQGSTFRSLSRRDSGFAFSIHEASEKRVMHGAGMTKLGTMYPELQMKSTALTVQAVVKLKTLQHRAQER